MTADALSQASHRPAAQRLVHRSDDTLRAMAARGNAEAFGAIYERHHRALYRYCCTILGHAEDAADAVHNTMAKAWEALPRAEPDVPLRPWLFRIAHNEAVSVLRKRRVDGALDEASIIAAGGLEETLEVRERLAALRADLAALTERQRGALLLRELCGLRHSEIAAVLAVSTSTARQTIYEARLALFEAEAGRGMACEAIQRALSDGDGRVRRGRRIRAHLRTCQLCAAFEESVRQNRSELAALAPPLPTGASLGVLARLLSQASTSGGISSVASGTATGPFGGVIIALAQLSPGVAAKVVVGSVVVAVGGVAGANRAVTAEHHAAAPVAFAHALDIRVVGGPLDHNVNGSGGPVEHFSPPAAATPHRAPAADPDGGANQHGPTAFDPGTASIAPQTVPGDQGGALVTPQEAASAQRWPAASDSSPVAMVTAPVATAGKAPAGQPAQPAASGDADAQTRPASASGPENDAASGQPGSPAVPSHDAVPQGPGGRSQAASGPGPDTGDPPLDPAAAPALRFSDAAVESPDPATNVTLKQPGRGAVSLGPVSSRASSEADPPAESHGQGPKARDKQPGQQGPPAESNAQSAKNEDEQSGRQVRPAESIGQGPKKEDEQSGQQDPRRQAPGRGPKNEDDSAAQGPPAESAGQKPKKKDKESGQQDPPGQASARGPKNKEDSVAQGPPESNGQGPVKKDGQSGRQAPPAESNGQGPKKEDEGSGQQDPRVSPTHTPPDNADAGKPDPPAASQGRAQTRDESEQQGPPTQPHPQDSKSADGRPPADPDDRAATKAPRDEPKSGDRGRQDPVAGAPAKDHRQ